MGVCIDSKNIMANETGMNREQEEAVKQLRKMRQKYLDEYSNGGKNDAPAVPDELEKQVWDTLILFQQFAFHTFRNLEFRYNIRGNEIFVDRKEKSITRATLDLALERSFMLQKDGVKITGPKKIGCFGASYLYPVFIQIGVIDMS